MFILINSFFKLNRKHLLAVGIILVNTLPLFAQISTATLLLSGKNHSYISIGNNATRTAAFFQPTLKKFSQSWMWSETSFLLSGAGAGWRTFSKNTILWGIYGRFNWHGIEAIHDKNLNFWKYLSRATVGGEFTNSFVSVSVNISRERQKTDEYHDSNPFNTTFIDLSGSYNQLQYVTPLAGVALELYGNYHYVDLFIGLKKFYNPYVSTDIKWILKDRLFSFGIKITTQPIFYKNPFIRQMNQAPRFFFPKDISQSNINDAVVENISVIFKELFK